MGRRALVGFWALLAGLVLTEAAQAQVTVQIDQAPAQGGVRDRPTDHEDFVARGPQPTCEDSPDLPGATGDHVAHLDLPDSR